MEGLFLLMAVLVVSQTVKDIFDKVYPNKQELIGLKEELSELKKKHEKLDPDKLDAMVRDVKAIKMNSALTNGRVR